MENYIEELKKLNISNYKITKEPIFEENSKLFVIQSYQIKKEDFSFLQEHFFKNKTNLIFMINTNDSIYFNNNDNYIIFRCYFEEN